MKRVLCVDDDMSLRNVFSIIFERAGYEAIVCSDGASILENDFPIPDIFILDKQLSGISGLDLCRFLKLQSRTQQIPIIIISASPTLAEDSLAAGADDYLEKPFKLKDILEKMGKYLSDHQTESASTF